MTSLHLVPRLVCAMAFLGLLMDPAGSVSVACSIPPYIYILQQIWLIYQTYSSQRMLVTPDRRLCAA